MRNKIQANCLGLILNNYKLCSSNKGKTCALRTMISGVAMACTNCTNATINANCPLKRTIYLSIK